MFDGLPLLSILATLMDIPDTQDIPVNSGTHGEVELSHMMWSGSIIDAPNNSSAKPATYCKKVNKLSFYSASELWRQQKC